MHRDHQDVHVVVLGQHTLTVTDPSGLMHHHRIAVSVHEDPFSALLTFAELAPDAVIVPTKLPGVDVPALVAAICGAGRRPCFVSWDCEREPRNDAAACLAAGAHGLLPPQVTVPELVSALHAAGVVAHQEVMLQVGELAVDLAGLIVHHGDQRCQLSPAQATLVESLARAYPHGVDRGELMQALGLTGRPHTLTQAVTRLRRQLRALELDWDPVAFVAGGYRLVPTAPSPAEHSA